MRAGWRRSGIGGAARTIGFALVLPIVLVAYAGYQALPVAPAPDSGSFHISVDVSLVVLHATVTDRQGRLIPDLDRQNFEVYESGVPQRIRLFRNEDIPVTVGLVVDHSTTMWPKLAEVTAAARTFAQFSNPEDEMFVVNFHEIARLGLPSAVRFTHDSGALQQAIMGAPTGGETALYDAIAMGLAELEAGSRDKKVLIVISDGGDNASKRSLGRVMNLACQSSAVIYTVGLFDDQDPDRNPGILKRLAKTTGGEAFLPGQPGEVVAISEQIARDIRHQYTIGYVPGNPARDGSYRAIRLVARAKGGGLLVARTRSGYFATDAPRFEGKGAN